MRKFIAIVSALIMGAVLAVVGVAPATAGAYMCDNRMDRHSTDAWPDNEFTQVSVSYRYCFTTNVMDPPFVKPYQVVVSYNMPGSSMNCDAFNRKYDGVRFNMYFWRPYDGTNFNPGAKVVTCDESTINSASQQYDLSNVPRLWFGPAWGDDRQPRWKINWTMMYNFRDDVHKAHWQRFSPGD